MAAIGGAVGCGALAVPSIRFIVAPAGGGAKPGRWIKTVALESLREGEPKRVALIADHRDAWTLEKAVELGAVWLVRRAGEVTAWSVTCPHLGCAVDRSTSGAGFTCPCHDSAFAADGAAISGPSPRGLDVLATRIEEGVVLVNFQRFRQGIPEKVPIG
jgi:cytochrome b6-f complex iron-sulfur subunit/menaquinol-cytochrome c reductase iron-sulfur subunit